MSLLHKEKSRSIQNDNETVHARCTSVCNINGGVSCGKILLVDVLSKKKTGSPHRVYAIIDEQSSTSLISSELADELGADGPREKYYLSTCTSEHETKYGRRVPGVYIRSLNGIELDLPTLVECESIPQDKREIPTPETAARFPHLKQIAGEIPPLDDDAEIYLLIGRDAPELLKVRRFINGPKGAPWAQLLSLGWTISGQTCLDLAGGPRHAVVRRTNVLPNHDIALSEAHSNQMPLQTYALIPCPNKFKITGTLSDQQERIRENVFHTSPYDNDVSFSCDDLEFLRIMEDGIHKNETGHWEMPLPFRQKEVRMPNNYAQALNRLRGLLRTLSKKPQMQKDYFAFMEKILERDHASPVPPEDARNKARSGQVWYLPHFGVYHPKKPTQIRVVFDSSAEYNGVSLNKELLPGPDMMNSLFGVLIRFRRENVAVMCDIEQMFHSFHVNPQHRDFLRFLWYEGNTPEKSIIEYQMNVHLFGNGPSPAVATYGLKKTASDAEEKFGETAAKFVYRNFYVDDGVTSLPTADQAIELVTTTQKMLAEANLRLHKVISNSVEVMEAFPNEDRGKDLRDLDLRCDPLPPQRSLGVYWNLEKDAFTYKVDPADKPFTRRGVLSIVNSIYDPLGLAAPVLLEGKLILQHLVIMGKKKNDKPLSWDDPLPEAQSDQWKRWRNSLPELEKIALPRCYHLKDFGNITRAEIYTFSDASKDAIGACVYLRLLNDKEEISNTLLFGQSKVAPVQTTSIPRLELCAAVLAAQAATRILKEIEMKIDKVTFYTDSKVVLGYIQNESRRFHVYVANRVQLIRRLSDPHRWRYVDTSENPADLATRRLSVSDLVKSNWLTGPQFLNNPVATLSWETKEFPLNQYDPEVRKVSVHIIHTTDRNGLSTNNFSRFSSFTSLQHAIANLIVVIKKFKLRKNKLQEVTRGRKAPVGSEHRSPTLLELQQATTVIIKAVQREVYVDEFKLQHQIRKAEEDHGVRRNELKHMIKRSALYHLNPFIDDDGILRVGGRLRRSKLEYREKHPVLMPKKHHVTTLIVRHYHHLVHHQGRLMTHGAIRQAGYWLVNRNQVVSKEINSCVTCKRLRGRPLEQQMADLPTDRMEETAPFTYVGFDVFGP